jgi:hydroxyacylglutathione hydrolase
MLQVQSFEFSPIRENTYVVYNQFNDCLIVDPGCYYSEECEQLQTFIQEMDLRPRMLLNTHCHLDHIFGNKFVAETFGLLPHIHRLEKQVHEYAPVSALMFNCPFNVYTGDFIFIDENATIKLGDDQLKVLFTPGHSPGSLSFYTADDGFILSGDVLFQQSIGRTDLPGGNLDVLLKSIRNELMVLPDDTKVFSGHGPATTVGEERRGNPFLMPDDG